MKKVQRIYIFKCVATEFYDIKSQLVYADENDYTGTLYVLLDGHHLYTSQHLSITNDQDFISVLRTLLQKQPNPQDMISPSNSI